jgi:hypothetical protein
MTLPGATCIDSITVTPDSSLCCSLAKILEEDTLVCVGTTLTLHADDPNSNLGVGSIGPAGGSIFLDQGSVINGWRFLEAAPANVPADPFSPDTVFQSTAWGCSGSLMLATGTAIGTGYSNTQAITNNCPDPTSAAYQCWNYSYNGYNDWFLPSQDEMMALQTRNGLGDCYFLQTILLPAVTHPFWTSTEVSSTEAVVCMIENSPWRYTMNQVKTNLAYAIPVRQSSGYDISYLWSNGSTTPSITVNPQQTTTYYLTVTIDGVSCLDSVKVTVDTSQAQIVPSGPIVLCPGDSAFLLASGGGNFTWSNGATTDTIWVNSPGDYYFVSTFNSCSDTSDIVQVLLNTTNPPVVTASIPSNPLCLSDPVQPLTGDPAGGNWSGPGVVSNGFFDPSLSGTGTFNLIYSYTPSGGCIDTAQLFVTVNVCTGISELNNVDRLYQVNPNPAKDRLMLSYKGGNRPARVSGGFAASPKRHTGPGG